MDNFIISHGPKWGPKGQALASQQIGGRKIFEWNPKIWRSS